MDINGTINSETLIGTADADSFFGMAGNDSIVGSGGIDTAKYTNAALEYRVDRYQDFCVVNSNIGFSGEGLDTLRGVEFIQFYDKVIRVSEPVYLSQTDMLTGSSISSTEVEVNNTSAAAQVIDMTAGKKMIQGAISTTSDRDIYKINPTANTDIEVALEGLTGNLSMRVWSDIIRDGIANDGEASFNWRSGSANEYVFRSDNAANTPIYIEVWRPTGGAISNYRLGVATVQSTPRTLADAADLGLITGAVTKTGNIGERGGEDWYKFNLDKAKSVNVSLNFAEGYGCAKLDIVGPNNFSRTVDTQSVNEKFFEGLAAGEYRVRVSDFVGYSQSAYSLSVSSGAITRTAPAGSTVITSANSSLGNAADLNGSGIEIAYSEFAANNLSSYTVESWVKPEAGATEWQAIAGRATPRNSFLYWSNLNYVRGFDYVNSGGLPVSTHINSAKTIGLNGWQHVALTSDGTVSRLYVNGNLVTTGLTYDSLVANTAPFRIGRADSGHSNWMGGIDEVRFWNRAKSGQEIQAQMNIPLTGTESGLIAYLPF